MLTALEAKFGELIDDLDLLGMPLTAARADHARNTFRHEAERLA